MLFIPQKIYKYIHIGKKEIQRSLLQVTIKDLENPKVTTDKLLEICC